MTRKIQLLLTLSFWTLNLHSQNQLELFTSQHAGVYTYSYMNSYTGKPTMYKGKDKTIKIHKADGELPYVSFDNEKWYFENESYSRVLLNLTHNEQSIALIDNHIYKWKGGTDPNKVIIQGIYKKEGYELKNPAKYESIIAKYLKKVNSEYKTKYPEENELLVSHSFLRQIKNREKEKSDHAHRMKPEVYANTCSQMMDYPSLSSAFSFLYGPSNTTVFNIPSEVVKNSWIAYQKALTESGLRFKDVDQFYTENPEKDFLIERELLAQKIMIDNGSMKEERLSSDSLYQAIKDGQRSSHKTSYFNQKIENVPVAYDFSGREKGEKGADVKIFVDKGPYDLYNDNCFKVEIRYKYPNDTDWKIIKKYVQSLNNLNEFTIVKDHFSRLIINMYGAHEGGGANITVYHTSSGKAIIYGRDIANSNSNEMPLSVFNSSFDNGREVYDNKGTYKMIEDNNITLDW